MLVQVGRTMEIFVVLVLVILMVIVSRQTRDDR
jgi:hypothetical protein